MKFTKLPGAATLLILSTALTGLACDCVTRNATESFADAKAVFVGTVIKAEVGEFGPGEGFHTTNYTLRVDRVLKGNIAGEVKLKDDSDCDKGFSLGWKYVVYAREYEGHYFAPSCLATRPLTDLRQDQSQDVTYVRGTQWRKIGADLLLTGYTVFVFVTGWLLLSKVRKRAD